MSTDAERLDELERIHTQWKHDGVGPVSANTVLEMLPWLIGLTRKGLALTEGDAFNLAQYDKLLAANEQNALLADRYEKALREIVNGAPPNEYWSRDKAREALEKP